MEDIKETVNRNLSRLNNLLILYEKCKKDNNELLIPYLVCSQAAHIDHIAKSSLVREALISVSKDERCDLAFKAIKYIVNNCPTDNLGKVTPDEMKKINRLIINLCEFLVNDCSDSLLPALIEEAYSKCN